VLCVKVTILTDGNLLIDQTSEEDLGEAVRSKFVARTTAEGVMQIGQTLGDDDLLKHILVLLGEHILLHIRLLATTWICCCKHSLVAHFPVIHFTHRAFAV